MEYFVYVIIFIIGYSLGVAMTFLLVMMYTNKKLAREQAENKPEPWKKKHGEW